MVTSVSLKVRDWMVFDGDGRGLVALDKSDPLSPPDPEKFCFKMSIYVGTGDPEGVDLFDLMVCSPSWLADHVSSDSWGRLYPWPRPSVVVGTGIWFMKRWDEEEFEVALKDLCSELSPGPNWGAVADRLSRYMPWEYSYRFDERVDRGEPYAS
jgi:Immunity protein 8